MITDLTVWSNQQGLLAPGAAIACENKSRPRNLRFGWTCSAGSPNQGSVAIRWECQNVTKQIWLGHLRGGQLLLQLPLVPVFYKGINIPWSNRIRNAKLNVVRTDQGGTAVIRNYARVTKSVLCFTIRRNNFLLSDGILSGFCFKVETFCLDSLGCTT